MDSSRPRWIKWTPVKVLGKGSFGVTLMVTRESDAYDSVPPGSTIRKALKIFWDYADYDADGKISRLTKSSFKKESELSLEINRSFLQNSLCPNFIETTRSLEIPFSFLVKDRHQYIQTKDEEIESDIPLSASDMLNIEFPFLNKIWSQLDRIVEEIEKFAAEVRGSRCGIQSEDGEIPTIGFLEMELALFGEASKLSRTVQTHADANSTISASLVRSISFQLYAMWVAMQLMGLQHRDINPRNLLFAKREYRSALTYSNPYVYSIRGLEYVIPEDDQEYVALLADFSLSAFIGSPDDLEIESPVIAADARPPEFFFLKDTQREMKYTAASELFSLGINLVSILLSDVERSNPDSLDMRVHTATNNEAYRIFVESISQKNTELGGSTQFGGFFSRSGKPNPLGFIIYHKDERFVWRLFTLLGVPTNGDWPGIESTPLWSIAAPLYKSLKRDPILFTTTTKSTWSGAPQKRLLNLLGVHGMKMLKAMLMWDPLKRVAAYEKACESYFEEYLIKNHFVANEYIQSYASHPIGWRNWGLQYPLRRCYNATERTSNAYGNRGFVRPGVVMSIGASSNRDSRRTTPEMRSTLTPWTQSRPPSSRPRGRVSFSCCNCGKPSRAVSHFYNVYHDFTATGDEYQYRHDSDGKELPLNDAKPFSFKAHICSKQCSDALFANKEFMNHACEPSLGLVRHYANILASNAASGTSRR